MCVGVRVLNCHIHLKDWAPIETELLHLKGILFILLINLPYYPFQKGDEMRSATYRDEPTSFTTIKPLPNTANLIQTSTL